MASQLHRLSCFCSGALSWVLTCHVAEHRCHHTRTILDVPFGLTMLGSRLSPGTERRNYYLGFPVRVCSARNTHKAGAGVGAIPFLGHQAPAREEGDVTGRRLDLASAWQRRLTDWHGAKGHFPQLQPNSVRLPQWQVVSTRGHQEAGSFWSGYLALCPTAEPSLCLCQ